MPLPHIKSPEIRTPQSNAPSPWLNFAVGLGGGALSAYQQQQDRAKEEAAGNQRREDERQRFEQRYQLMRDELGLRRTGQEQKNRLGYAGLSVQARGQDAQFRGQEMATKQRTQASEAQQLSSLFSRLDKIDPAFGVQMQHAYSKMIAGGMDPAEAMQRVAKTSGVVSSQMDRQEWGREQDKIRLQKQLELSNAQVGRQEGFKNTMQQKAAFPTLDTYMGGMLTPRAADIQEQYRSEMAPPSTPTSAAPPAETGEMVVGRPSARREAAILARVKALPTGMQIAFKERVEEIFAAGVEPAVPGSSPVLDAMAQALLELRVP